MTQPFEFNKPLSEMTPEDIAQARRDLQTARDRLAGAEADPVATLEAVADAPSLPDEGEAEEWPHQFLEYEGVMLEARVPDESALMAVSMVSSGGLSGEIQMKIFTKFLQHHLSEASFARVLEEMVDSDSKMNLVGLVTAMTSLRQ